MTQPLENVLALAFANVRLGLKLAETWRESGQNLMELATRGAAEISEETGVALVASMSADKGATVNSVNGHWQDLLAEVEAVRDATAREIETALRTGGIAGQKPSGSMRVYRPRPS
jgi:uncharacterized protein (DUF1697 family)